MTTNGPNDDDLRVLRALASHEPSRELAERVRRQAHVELTPVPWVTFVARAWMRVALPAAITVTVVGYLSWAVGTASALYR